MLLTLAFDSKKPENIENVSVVIVPTLAGHMGILPGRQNFVSLLDTGAVYVATNNKVSSIYLIESGILEAKGNNTRIAIDGDFIKCSSNTIQSAVTDINILMDNINKEIEADEEGNLQRILYNKLKSAEKMKEATAHSLYQGKLSG